MTLLGRAFDARRGQFPAGMAREILDARFPPADHARMDELSAGNPGPVRCSRRNAHFWTGTFGPRTSWRCSSRRLGFRCAAARANLNSRRLRPWCRWRCGGRSSGGRIAAANTVACLPSSPRPPSTSIISSPNNTVAKPGWITSRSPAFPATPTKGPTSPSLDPMTGKLARLFHPAEGHLG